MPASIDLATPLALVGFGVLLFVLPICGPLVAALALERRRRRARDERRSPLVENLLRSPGSSLRAQLEASEEDVTEALVVLVALPLGVAAAVLASAVVSSVRTLTFLVPACTVLTACVVAFYVVRLLRFSRTRDILRQGYDAELAVGQELDQLMRHGAQVFHDVPADGFNVDHVVVAESGIDAVETKGYTKVRTKGGKVDARVACDGKSLRFPHRTTVRPLEQAERQARWVSARIAPFLDAPARVVPVVALPGWYIERTGRGPVLVYSGKELRKLLSARTERRLTSREVDRVARSIEQLCRTVTPLYADR